MIKEIEIYGLFGEEKKKISIKFNEGLTVLVGKNGCGKTTILNIINTIMNGKYPKLWQYNFEKIKFTYNDDVIFIHRFANKIVIYKNNVESLNQEINLKIDCEDDYENCIVSLDQETRSMIFTEIPKDCEDENIKQVLGRHPRPLYFPTYRRTEIDFSEMLWQYQDINMNRRRTPYLSDRYINNNYFFNKEFENTVVGITNGDIVEIIKDEWLKVSNFETHKLNSLITDFFLCFIDTKNSTNGSEILNKIDTKQLNYDIKNIFKNTGLARNGQADWRHNIDKYTKTVSKAQNINTEDIYDDNKYNEEIREEKFRSFLENLNLVNSITHSLAKITEIIEIYKEACNSIEMIKSPFRELQNSLTDFMKPKEAVISDGNLYFIKGNDKLEFEDLSAGEKQLITLFVYISLVAQQDSTIMIDEPELSLHVTWQRKIIKNLLNNKRNVQYIIATHSPFVISEYRNAIKKIGEIDYEELL